MTKQQFLDHVRALYVVANTSDSTDDPRRENWTKPSMAGEACASHLDAMLQSLTNQGVFTLEEIQAFYDDM